MTHSFPTQPVLMSSMCPRYNSHSRKKKLVQVNGTTIVPYDHLILTTGAQYQVPAPTDADIAKPHTNSEVPNSPDRRYDAEPPRNMLLVNDDYDAAVALYWVENNLLGGEGEERMYSDYCLSVPIYRKHSVMWPNIISCTWSSINVLGDHLFLKVTWGWGW